MKLQQLSLARLTGLCGNEVTQVFSSDAIVVLIFVPVRHQFFDSCSFSTVTPICYEKSNNANGGNKMKSVR